MKHHHEIIKAVVRRSLFSVGNALRGLLILISVFSPSVLLAQYQGSPQVFYAAAPEWPLLDTTKTERTETVLVKVTVDGFGNVVDSRSRSPKSAYSEAAVRAARLWKFSVPVCDDKPNILNGMTAILRFTFQVVRTKTPDEPPMAFISPYEIRVSRLMRNH